MHKVLQYTAVVSLGFIVGMALPYTAWSYASFQRLPHVSDAAPFCAGCHSSWDAAYHPELPAEAALAQVYTTKHYKALEGEGSPAYKTLTPDDRKQLLERAKKVDQNSSVKLEAPATVAPGGTITVTVSTKGGIGPVVGVMLVDEPIRYQARPIQGAGWFIAGPPEIIGADGKPQGNWLDRRHNKQQTNLNFVLVYGVSADPDKNVYPTSRVSYLLKAPQTSGEYTITAAFLYGTSEPNEMKTEKYVDPPGGGSAPSGRLQFSNVARVRVQ